MKTRLTGFFFAGVVAVLPTVMIAELASQGPGPSTKFVNAQSIFAGPATRPAHVHGEGGDEGGGNGVDGGGGVGPFGGGGGPDGGGRPHPGQFARRAVTQQEVQAAIDFFNQNSPVRMVYFTKLREGSAARIQATGRLVFAYRPIANFKDSNPDLYALLVKQVQLRDDAFKLARQGKEDELREKAAEIVPISLKARSMRLDLLQKELDDQKKKLADDTKDPDGANEREIALIKDDEDWWVRKADHAQGTHGNSMLNFDPAADPLAEAAPITYPTDPQH